MSTSLELSSVKLPTFPNTFKLWINRGLRACSCIMGNQGKISKKQRGKIYFFLYFSALSFIFKKKLLLQVEKPVFYVYLRFWVDRVIAVGIEIFLRLKSKNLIKS